MVGVPVGVHRRVRRDQLELGLGRSRSSVTTPKTGDYHIMVSLSATDSATFNASILPTVTVFDPRIARRLGPQRSGDRQGGVEAGGRHRCDGEPPCLRSTRPRLNCVDDDSNGVVDDEDWGPAGAAGDFRMSVPALTPIGVNLNQTTWAPATGFVSGPADVDLAISAADDRRPTAPGS